MSRFLLSASLIITLFLCLPPAPAVAYEDYSVYSIDEVDDLYNLYYSGEIDENTLNQLQNIYYNRRINLNTATEEELDLLPGIDSLLARRIIDFREENGLFKKIEDIQQIEGFDDLIFNKIKIFIEVIEPSKFAGDYKVETKYLIGTTEKALETQALLYKYGRFRCFIDDKFQAGFAVEKGGGKATVGVVVPTEEELAAAADAGITLDESLSRVLSEYTITDKYLDYEGDGIVQEAWLGSGKYTSGNNLVMSGYEYDNAQAVKLASGDVIQTFYHSVDSNDATLFLTTLRKNLKIYDATIDEVYLYNNSMTVNDDLNIGVSYLNSLVKKNASDSMIYYPDQEQFSISGLNLNLGNKKRYIKGNFALESSGQYGFTLYSFLTAGKYIFKANLENLSKDFRNPYLSSTEMKRGNRLYYILSLSNKSAKDYTLKAYYESLRNYTNGEVTTKYFASYLKYILPSTFCQVAVKYSNYDATVEGHDKIEGVFYIWSKPTRKIVLNAQYGKRYYYLNIPAKYTEAVDVISNITYSINDYSKIKLSVDFYNSRLFENIAKTYYVLSWETKVSPSFVLKLAFGKNMIFDPSVTDATKIGPETKFRCSLSGKW